MPMVLTFTLDGVVQFDTVHQEIAQLRENEEVLEEYFSNVENEDAMLLGRITFQDWKDYWPTSDNQPFANHIDNVNKYVFSNTLKSVSWGECGSVSLINDNHYQSVKNS